MKLRSLILINVALSLAIAGCGKKGSDQQDVEAQIRSVGPQAEAALYSIAETATQNALLHARAKRVRIEVGSDNGTVSLRVIDDGIGFDVEAAEVRHPGMGLFKMRKRAAMIGASLYIDSPLGRGTTVDVTLPATPTTLTRH